MTNEQIAKRNVTACFNQEVGEWYNCILDDCTEYIPDTKDEAKEYIYDCAINDLYAPGYCGSGKAPREMRFAGEQYIRQVIDDLFAEDEDGDIAEIAEAKGW